MPARRTGARLATGATRTAPVRTGGCPTGSTSSPSTLRAGSWCGSPWSRPMARVASTSSTTSTSIRMRRADTATELTAGALPADPRAQDPADRLLEESWTGRQRRAAKRELVVEASAGALFLTVAVPLAVPTLLTHHIDPSWALLLVGLYALVS